jgi:hypothetical protein
VDLEASVAVTLRNETSGSFALCCTLRYTTAEPYAVHLVFPTLDPDTQPIVWSLSRELLTAGLHRPAGLGDVHLRPSGTDNTALTLRGKNGTATLSLRSSQLLAFLERTEQRTPSGTEARFIDWDKLSEQLSSRTPWP